MRLHQCIEILVPEAKFICPPWSNGPFYDVNESNYNAMNWIDTRPKPTWEEVRIVWFDLLKDDLYREIERVRDEKLTSGVVYQFPSGLVGTIQTRNLDDHRNIQVNAATAQYFLMVGLTNQPMVFRDTENIVHNLLPNEMCQMALYVSSISQQHFTNSWWHKDNLKQININDQTTVEQAISQLENYDLYSNWDIV